MNVQLSAGEAIALFNRWCKGEIDYTIACRGNTADGGEYAFKWREVTAMMHIPIPGMPMQQNPQVIMGQQKPNQQFGAPLMMNNRGAFVSGQIVDVR